VARNRRLQALRASLQDLDNERLSTRFREVEPGHVELGSCPERCRVRVTGEVTSLRLVPRAGSPCLEATVDDGSGCAVAVFNGRRAIRGLDPGRAVVLEGVARRERGRLTLVNPAYTLLP
jgi:hypothetical protein